MLTSASIERRWIQVGGVRALVRVSGSGSPVVLIHGLGCSGAYFEALIACLSPRFRVYAPDLPGHGRSDKPQHSMWRLCELTDWIAALLDDCELDAPLIVGHSLGGGVAVDLAARYPEKVGALVLLAPTGVPDMPPLPGQIPLLALDGLREPLRLFPLILPAYLRAGPRRILRLAIDQTRYSHRQRLHQIRAPMLAIRGSRDPIVARAAIDDLRAECGDVESLELEHAAHALQVSRPHQVADAICRFFDALIVASTL